MPKGQTKNSHTDELKSNTSNIVNKTTSKTEILNTSIKKTSIKSSSTQTKNTFSSENASKDVLSTITEKTSKKTSKKTSTKKVHSKNSTKKKNSKSTAKKKTQPIIEYYDLPYRYNKTVVKLLAQTPTSLFIYWDISDKDREKYKNTYGEKFFEDTKPVLVIHNITKDYIYEVDINDFANCWYLKMSDSNCKYVIELGRRNIVKNANIPHFISISASNKMDSPNDHILFEKLPDFIEFKNIKTNSISNMKTKEIINSTEKIYNVYDLYREIYKDENILNNIGSSNSNF